MKANGSRDDPTFRVANGYVGDCEQCGKRSFTSRKAARAAARKANHGHMQAYPCGLWWHVGHLPDALRRGEMDKDDWQRRRR